MKTYVWLSFCDPNLPEGSQFLGVVVLESKSLLGAVASAHAKGINPGGQVEGIMFECAGISEKYLSRLLTRAEAQSLDMIMAETIDGQTSSSSH